jgi:hypothetical protein
MQHDLDAAIRPENTPACTVCGAPAVLFAVGGWTCGKHPGTYTISKRMVELQLEAGARERRSYVYKSWGDAREAEESHRMENLYRY